MSQKGGRRRDAEGRDTSPKRDPASGRRAASRGRRAAGGERQAAAGERRAEGGGRRATGKGQRAADSERRVAGGGRRAVRGRRAARERRAAASGGVPLACHTFRGRRVQTPVTVSLPHVLKCLCHSSPFRFQASSRANIYIEIRRHRHKVAS